MKTAKLLLALCYLALLLGACKKDKFEQTKEQLIGEWAWQYSTGGLLAQTLNPATEGYEASILFQKNGTFTQYRDTTTQFTHYYWVEKGSSIFGSEEVYLLFLGSQNHSQVFNTYSIIFDGVDNLELKEECNDCLDNFYKRKE